MKSKFYNVVLFFTLSLFILMFSCAKQDLGVLVKNYEQAYNSHDLEKIMSFYADDIKFEVVDVVELSGKVEVKGLIEFEITLNNQLMFENIKVRGDSAICDLTENNDWLKAMDIEAAHYSPTIFIFKDGLIQQIKATEIPETMDAKSSAVKAIMEWASENKPEKLKEMMPEGKFVYNATNAKEIIDLIDEWKEAVKEKE